MAGNEDALSYAFLEEQLTLARKAGEAVRYSSGRVERLGPLAERPSDEALVELDALTARFARLADILLQKVFRAIDAVELVDEGSLIDRMNRAEKRGIIDSAAQWREIRQLRNQIAHDYVITDQRELFEATIRYAPELLRTLEKIEGYSKSVRRT